MYAVLGVTGNTGSAVVERLLARGESVRAVVRDATKAASLKARGVEIAVADVTDTAALTIALTGVKGAYLMIPPPYAAEDFMGAVDVAAASIAKAAAAASVPYVVALSSVGAHMPKGNGAIASLTLFERLLAEAGLKRTILRPVYFMSNWGNVAELAKAQGILPSMLQPLDRPVPLVSTDDIGHIAADLLIEPAAGSRVIHVAGPRDYSPAEVAATFGRLLGKDVQPVAPPDVAWEQIIVDAGLSRTYAAGLVEMYRGLNDGSIGPSADEEMRRGPTTLEEALKRYA